MAAGFEFVPSVAGVTCAAAAVVGGAPLFSIGLRAWRRRRALAALREAPLSEFPAGYVRVTGRVGLESPLVTPISGKACAGFRLEAHGVDVPVARAIEDVRGFRLVANGASAQVPGAGTWDLPVTAEVVIEPDAPITERMVHLLEQMPEACWIRQSGRRLRLVERALLAGSICTVVGHAVRGRRAVALPLAQEWVRTGTDDVALPVQLAAAPILAASNRGPELHAAHAFPGRGAVPGSETTASIASEPTLFFGAHDGADLLHVSVNPPDVQLLRAPASHLVGLVAGPLLALGGLLYLAAAADRWRAAGGF